MNRRSFLRNGVWLLLLLTCLPCFGQIKIQDGTLPNAGLAIAPVVGGTCATEQIATTGAAQGDLQLWAFDTVYTAGAFTTVGGFTLCKVVVTNLWRVGNPSFNITGYIYSDDGGAPSKPTSTLLATTTGTVAASTLPTSNSGTPITFNFSGLALSGTTKYWFATHPSAQGDASNYINWTYNGTFFTTGFEANSPDAITWTDQLIYQLEMETFSP